MIGYTAEGFVKYYDAFMPRYKREQRTWSFYFAHWATSAGMGTIAGIPAIGGSTGW